MWMDKFKIDGRRLVVDQKLAADADDSDAAGSVLVEAWTGDEIWDDVAFEVELSMN